MPRESDHAQFDDRPVTLRELRKLASEGALRRRRRRSKYRETLLAFKNSQQPAREVRGLTHSQVSQLVSSISTVFGSEEVKTKTLNKEGQGKETRFDIILIRMTPETEHILSNATVYSGSKGKVTATKSETHQEP